MENLNVQKGQTVVCIKTVRLNSCIPEYNHKWAFSKGKEYKSHQDGALIDNMQDTHWVNNTGNWFNEHFILKTESNESK